MCALKLIRCQTNKDNMRANSYPKPGPIENNGLIKARPQISGCKSVQMKENLLEHFDYEVLPRLVFIQLKEWYGVDTIIVRHLKVDLTNPNSMQVDIYPELKFTRT